MTETIHVPDDVGAGARVQAPDVPRKAEPHHSRTTGPRPAVEALLLDLDGTLLDIDFRSFMNDYVTRLAARFADCIEPQLFRRQLFLSTRAMIFNTEPGRTTLEAFLDDFGAVLPLPDDSMARFEDFYATEFPRLGRWGRPLAGGRELIQAALNRGLKAAVATAPFFPEQAIRERLRWAGVADLPFALITSSDTMTRSKPFPEFYLEIAKRIGVAPEACLMVGDEALMDGSAARAGMQVALVGPDKPSFSGPWLDGTPLADAPVPDAPRWPDLPALHRHLVEQGIL